MNNWTLRIVENGKTATVIIECAPVIDDETMGLCNEIFEIEMLSAEITPTRISFESTNIELVRKLRQATTEYYFERKHGNSSN